MKIQLLAATAALLALAAACANYKAEKVAEAAKGSRAGKKGEALQPAPDFALPDADGKILKLSDYKGKVVLLDFWATWCGPCKIEIPWFMEFQRKYKDRGFTVIGVSMDDGWQVVKPFVKEFKMNYPVVLGNDETADKFGKVDVLPTTFIIDKQGRIVEKHEGLASKDEMEKAILDLL